MKKLISNLICISMIFGILPTFTAAEESNLESIVYTSNEDFTVDGGNCTWGAVWSAMMHDENGDYQPLNDEVVVNPAKNDVSGGYGSAVDSNYYPIVNGHQIVDPNLPLNALGKEHSRYPVRVFTAPKDGTITIGSTEIKDRSGQNKTAYIIKKTADDVMVLWEKNINGWNAVTTDELSVDVTEGDKIFFEVRRNSTNSWNRGHVTWVTTVGYGELKPVVTSTPSPSIKPTTKPTDAPLRTVYTSNENFSTATADGSWDSGIWSAKCYFQEWWSYSNLTDVSTSGKYYLHWLESGLAKVDGTTFETDTITSNFTARAFTVPQDGTIRIEKTDVINKSTTAAKFQIRTGTGSTVLKAVEVQAGETTEQNAVETKVSAGDVIYFEVGTASTDGGVMVEWINTITYIEDVTPTPTVKPTVAPKRTVYNSNEYFSTSTADGSWDNSIWSAKCYYQDWWIYSNLTNVTSNGKYNLGWLENGMARVDGTTLETDTITDDYTARVFTVPEEGTIRIEQTDVTNQSEYAAKFRIRIAKSSGIKNVLDVTNIDAMETVKQPEISVTVEEGDIFYFEAATDTKGKGVTVKWINTLTYTATATPPPKPTPAPPLEDGIYKSSHNFIPEDGCGVWENVWSAEIYNSVDKTYTEVKTEYNDGYAENNYDENQPIVYGVKMRVSGEINPTKHPVRKFIVPEDGKLRILQSEITNKTWEDVQYTIKLNDKVIWTKVYSDCAEKLIQPEQRLETVKKGDIIRFEVILKNATTYGYDQMWENTILSWDGAEPTPTPIPTPTPNPDFAKKEYRASDSWSTEKNGDNAWKWQSYKVNTKSYENLPTKMESNLNMGDDWTDGPVWISGSDWRWVAVGKYTMRGTVDPGDPMKEEESGDFKVHRDYPVRTFTSPKNGNVIIKAFDNKIKSKDDINGTHIRIVCKRADGSKPIQIFPKEDWLNVKGEYNFEPIELELNVGDKLMFENAFIWKYGGCSPWNSYVWWDPIIEYKTIKPKLVRTSPETGAENVELNAEHIFTYDEALNNISNDKVTVYEIRGDESVLSEAICSEISVENSKIRFVLDGLKPYTEYKVKIDGISYLGFDATNEKSETVVFTTGSIVNIGSAKYQNGKVSVSINNSEKEKKTATLIAAICKGTESQYSIEKIYYVTRSDIGADDVIEVEVDFPSGEDYFIKAIVMEDMQKAQAYAPASIIRR